MNNDKPLREWDFSDRVREKNGLSYVSWADIWDTVLQIDPEAEYKIHQFPTPEGGTVPYQQLGIGVMVYVDLTLKGKTRTGYLPVMDHRNKTVPNPTATDINNTIQRCLSKAAAMHGLSLYVYRGEDVSPALERAREEEREAVESALSDAANRLRQCRTKDDLQNVWEALTKEERTALRSVKDEMKEKVKVAA